MQPESEPTALEQLTVALKRIETEPTDNIVNQLGDILQTVATTKQRLERLTGRRKEIDPARLVASVMVPIIQITLGDDNMPLQVHTNWEPAWKGEVENTVTAVNGQIFEKKFGFVDSQGHCWNPMKTVQSVQRENVEAVGGTIESKLKDIALSVPVRPSEFDGRKSSLKR